MEIRAVAACSNRDLQAAILAASDSHDFAEILIAELAKCSKHRVASCSVGAYPDGDAVVAAAQ